MSNVTITHPSPAHSDDRGDIMDVINTVDPFHHIGLITFAPNAVRANHYHKESDQYDFILEGKIQLATKDAHDPHAEIETAILEPGDLVHIPKNTIHAYKALEPSKMIDVTTTSRQGTGYEDDTFRIDPILQ